MENREPKIERRISTLNENTKVVITLEKVITLICSLLVVGFGYLFTQISDMKETLSDIRETSGRIDERLKNNEKELLKKSKTEEDLKKILRILEEKKSGI